MTLQERFDAKFIAIGLGGCWPWTGGLNDGYGWFYNGSRAVKAPRFSYEIHCGPIPKGICVLHRCDNRLCVRPGHLFLGTIADNNRDKAKKGRAPSGETHPSAKFSDADVAEIRAIDGTVPRHEIAARYGIDQSYISQLVMGKFRKTVARIR